MSEIKLTSGVDDRVQLSKVVPLNTPFTLNIFPTNACNFRCNYCAQSLAPKQLLKEYNFRLEHMKIEVIEQIVEQSKEFKEKFKLVSMMGHGEPLVNSLTPQMVGLIKQANITGRIDMITNASLLTREKSLELVDNGLDVIRISIQGLSAEKYKQISQVNINFEEFIEQIGFLYRHKKQCQVFVKIVDKALDDGGEEQKFYRIFESISDRMSIERIKPVYDGVEYDEKVTEVSIDRCGNEHEKRIVCPQPFYMLSVWPNGDVSPCDGIYKANYLGNIHEKRLKEMWKSEALKKFCIMQLEKKKELHPKCKRCCAPNDVSHEADVLDLDAEELLKIAYQ